jgi:hypothetical protein
MPKPDNGRHFAEQMVYAVEMIIQRPSHIKAVIGEIALLSKPVIEAGASAELQGQMCY